VRDPGPPNPFVYDRPLPAGELIDRDEELRLLVHLAESGQSTRLVGPRRYGKTTLALRALADAERIGLEAVYVDLYGAVSLDLVADRVERAYAALRGPVARAVRAFLRARPAASAGIAGVHASVRSDAGAPASEQRLLRLLELPQAIHARTGRRTLVVFDEFQEVLRAARHADALMRSVIQHHANEASYVFAGSHPGLMLALFAERSRPFFGQTRPVELAPLPSDALAEYVEERLGVDAPDAVDQLVAEARGHPQRAMMLAHHLWEELRSAPTPLEAWDRALDACDAELGEGYARLWDELPTNATRVLAAVAAAGEETLFHRRTLRRFGLTPAGAQKGRDHLVALGEVRVGESGRLELVDPLLGRWIANRSQRGPYGA
jgi:uncharacterized protein